MSLVPNYHSSDYESSSDSEPGKVCFTLLFILTLITIAF